MELQENFHFPVIKSPKRSREIYCLYSVLLSAQILSGRVICNHWMKCSEIWGYGRYECKVVQEGSKFKMSDFKAGPRACPKLPKFCLTLAHSRDCSELFLK